MTSYGNYKEAYHNDSEKLNEKSIIFDIDDYENFNQTNIF